MNSRTFLGILSASVIAIATSTRIFAADPTSEALPQVLIIGDSISIGYTPHVKKLLKDAANVSHNEGNAANTGNGLEKIDAWLGDTKWQVIQFNWGLHDLCYRNPKLSKKSNRDKVNGTVTTTLADYGKNLELLVQRLEKTGAKLIWVNTTIVPEGEAGRIAGDEKKYNEVAAEVMKKHSIPITDLHTVSASIEPALFEGPGNVHFKLAGNKKLAKPVADGIRKLLKAPSAR
jgi:hypothetical protein